jgi:ribosome-associated toxin RatA of RatAB toxin-antitoxin module
MVFIYILLAVILLLAILSFVLPDKYLVEKSVVVDTNVSAVFDNVADLGQYKNWNPWQKMEPTSEGKVSGTPKTVGHQYEWIGKKIGSGSLTLKELTENKTIHFDLEFLKPWKSKAADNWHFEEINENQCKVTWSNSGGLPAGMARLMGPMIKKQLNQQFEEGLTNLKNLSEGK